MGWVLRSVPWKGQGGRAEVFREMNVTQVALHEEIRGCWEDEMAEPRGQEKRGPLALA